MNLRILFRLLLMVAIACAVAPAYAQKASAVNPASGVAAAGAANEAEIGELKERVKELEARERQSYAMELENGRKAVDWWLSFIGVLAAIMAIAGGLIPYLIGRKDKEVLEKDMEQVRRTLEEVRGMKAEAARSVDSILKHEEIAAESAAKLQTFQISENAKPDAELQKTMETVMQDQAADPLLRLRAEAIAASQEKNAEKAYKLWAALAELAEKDESAHFNAGFWAYELGEQTQGDEKLRWLRLAGENYRMTLAIKPDIHGAAYNWGNALAAEARSVAATDLAAARSLWQQAGAQYQRALSIKPDIHEAANNWGTALAAEAQTVAATDLAAARGLWQQAGAQYQRALSIKPDYHEAAYNWGIVLAAEARAIAQHDPGRSRQLMVQAEQLLLEHANATPGLVAYNLACVYGLRADVQSCLKWLATSQENGKLPTCEHIRSDKDLDPVRNDPAFIEWLNQVCTA